MTVTFVATILERTGPTSLTLRVRNTTAVGANDGGSTRGFALLLLRHAVGDLHEELRGEVVDDEWCRQNIGRYVAFTDVLERRNVQPQGRWPEDTDEVVDFDPSRWESRRAHEDALCERFHHFVLEVHVSDPRWIDDLAPGTIIESAATELWVQDPDATPLPPP